MRIENAEVSLTMTSPTRPII